MSEIIFDKIKSIVDPVYLVGGAVRDEIMGRQTFDIDISTPLKPDIVQQKLHEANIKTYLVGKKFGTIGCKIDDYDIQITTFRGETYEKGSRKPTVNFIGDIYEDLARRDFTINAIAKNSGEIIDPFDGIKDIKNKVIRAVGNADVRFSEDPLRMLRAFRFASELGFGIETDTLMSINRKSSEIINVSRERIASELEKIMLGKYHPDALNSFIKSDLFKYLLPELYFLHEIKPDQKIIITTIEDGLIPRWRTLTKSLLGNIGIDDDVLANEILRRIGTYYRWPKNKLSEIDI